jgi:hypothetical protein
MSTAAARIFNGPVMTIPTASLAAGSLDVQSGSFNVTGASTISPGATFSIAGGNYSAGGAFNNNGTATISVPSFTIGSGGTSAGAFFLGSGTTLSIPSVYTLSANGSLSGGTVSKPSGTLTVAGSFNPTTLNINGGTVNINGSSSITNANLSSGTLGGSGSVIVSNDFAWSGGSVSANGTLDLTSQAGIFPLLSSLSATSLRLAAPMGTISTAYPLSGTNSLLLQASTVDLLPAGPLTSSSLVVLTGGTIQSRSGIANINSPSTVMAPSLLYIEPSGNVPAGITMTGGLAATATQVIVRGAGASAKLDVAGDLGLTVGSGGMLVQGGSGANASASIDPQSFVIRSSGGNISLAGGSGANASALVVSSGSLTVGKLGGANFSVSMVAGGGPGANAGFVASGGPMTLEASFCDTCSILTSNPLAASQLLATGLFASGGVSVVLDQPLATTSAAIQQATQQVTNTVIASIQLAQQPGASQYLTVVSEPTPTSPTTSTGGDLALLTTPTTTTPTTTTTSTTTTTTQSETKQVPPGQTVSEEKKSEKAKDEEKKDDKPVTRRVAEDRSSAKRKPITKCE